MTLNKLIHKCFKDTDREALTNDKNILSAIYMDYMSGHKDINMQNAKTAILNINKICIEQRFKPLFSGNMNSKADVLKFAKKVMVDDIRDNN